MSVITRVCPSCATEKELSVVNFYRRKTNKSGFHCWCKVCVLAHNKAFDNKNEATRKRRSERVMRSRNRTSMGKAAHVRSAEKWRRENYIRYRDTRVAKRLGVPKGWLLEQIDRTKGMCEICGVVHLTAEHPRFISVDHCHTTGKVRGLLCSNCNFGIGNFKNDVKRLKAAQAYLEKYAQT